MSKLTTLLHVLLLVLLAHVSTAATWYVRQGSTGNGTSWSNAFGNVSDALPLAAGGDQIWVSAGTYKPIADASYNATLNTVARTYNIPSGVKLYGGFPAVGSPVFTDRDAAVYLTVLSGDHSSNDGGNLLPNNSLLKENSQSLLQMHNVNSSTQLDGFTIQGGIAKGNTNGVSILGGNERYNGGALFITGESAPEISNCIFTRNLATNSGAAIYVWPGYVSGVGYQTATPFIHDCVFEDNRSMALGASIGLDASPAATIGAKVRDCEFAKNRSRRGGAAIASNARKFGNIELEVDRCTFFRNVSNRFGSCFYYDSRDGFVNSVVANSLFQRNRTKREGAVHFAIAREARTNHHRYVNNTFVENETGAAEAMLFTKCRNNPAPGLHSLDLYNNIFDGNINATGTNYWRFTSNSPNVIIDANNNALDTTACPAWTNCLGSNYFGVAPQFVGGNNYRLQSASALVDAGDQAYFVTSSSTDLEGNARVIGSNVDVGCYENTNPPVPCPPILHVNALATGGNNGSSWADAFTNLRDAMDFARANTACVTEVWVAEGTYFSTGTSGAGAAASIELVSGVAVYGGFPNTGTPAFTDRDWQAHPTILDGDFQQDALLNNNSLDFFSSPSALTTGTIVDGFELRNLTDAAFQMGIFNTPTNAQISNLLLSNCNKFMIYANQTNTTLDVSNVTVRNSNGGDASFLVFAAAGVDNSTFTNCIWENNNKAAIELNASGSAQLNTRFSACEFTNNNAAASFVSGAVVSCYTDNSALVAPQFVNCLVAENTGAQGGVLAMGTQSGGTIQPEFINCTIYGNTATSVGGVLISAFTTNGPHQAYFKNCILWDNVGNQGGNVAWIDDSFGCPFPNEVTFDNCLIDASTLFMAPDVEFAAVLFGGFPCGAVFANNTTLSGTAPTFVSTTPGSLDLRLQTGSNGIDAGDNSFLPTGVTTDLDGNNRVFNSVVDAGCYENQTIVPPCPPIVHVNKLATGANNGTSWADAFTELQDALTFVRANPGCGNEIWVAEGNYLPSNSGSTAASFDLISGIKLYGGFPNTGNPGFSARNWQTHPTVLDGDLTNNGAAGPNSSEVVSYGALASTTLTDGFIIEGGSLGLIANISGTSQGVFRDLHVLDCALGLDVLGNSGASVSDQYFNVTFEGGTFGHTTDLELNSAVCDMLFEGCRWTNNNGGCVKLFTNFSSSGVPIFLGCQFDNNAGVGVAGGVLQNGTSSGNNNGRPEFTNCLMYNNGAQDGGAVANASGGGVAHPLFTNCTFYNHTAVNAGGLVYNGFNNGGDGVVTFNNCIVWACQAPIGFITYQDDSNFCFDITEIYFNDCSIDAFDCFDPMAYSTFQFVFSGMPGCAPVWCGGNNTFAFQPPLFQSITAGSENFRLAPSSFGIDEGNNASLPFYAGSDIAGNQRIDGGSVDKGCYENFPGMLKTASTPPQQQLSAVGSKAATAMSVFPNPASTRVTLKAGDGAVLSRATLFDATGRLIRIEQNLHSAQLTWTLDGLTSGIYMVQLESDAAVQTFRLLVE